MSSMRTGNAFAPACSMPRTATSSGRMHSETGRPGAGTSQSQRKTCAPTRTVRSTAASPGTKFMVPTKSATKGVAGSR